MRTFPRGTFLDPWYVTGFVEGEGTFTFSRSNSTIGLYFGLRLNRADLPVLEHIQDFFGGIGKIYEQKKRSPIPKGGWTKSASYYRVTRCRDLASIVRHFEEFPLAGTKADSFEIWKEMVRLKLRHFRRPPMDELEGLAKRLSAVSPRNQDWE